MNLFSKLIDEVFSGKETKEFTPEEQKEILLYKANNILFFKKKRGGCRSAKKREKQGSGNRTKPI